MTDLISETTRERLACSLVLVQANRAALVEGMKRALLSSEGREEPLGDTQTMAQMLVDMLVGEAWRVVSEGSAADLAAYASEQAVLGIDGRHYSRFGDALVPLMRDVLGLSFPAEMAGAWVDTFWALVRAVVAVRNPANESLPA